MVADSGASICAIKESKVLQAEQTGVPSRPQLEAAISRKQVYNSLPGIPRMKKSFETSYLEIPLCYQAFHQDLSHKSRQW